MRLASRLVDAFADKDRFGSLSEQLTGMPQK